MNRSTAALPRALTTLLLALVTVLVSLTPVSVAEVAGAQPSGVRRTEVADLHHDPIGRRAYVARTARDISSPTHVGRVLAMGFLDITGFDDVRTRGREVVDVAELRTSDPALYRQLRLDERPEVERFLILTRSNNRSVWRENEVVQQGEHAEERVLADVLDLRVPTGRLFAVYADFSPCVKTCTPQLPRTADVFYGTVYRKPGYTMKLRNLLTDASAVTGGDADFQKEVAAEKARLADLKEENTERKYEEARRKHKTVKKTRHLLSTGDGDACGRPNLGLRMALGSRPGASTAGCGAPSDAAGSGLLKALTDPPSKTGGIDFSSMRLRYLSDPGDGSGLQYSFSARVDPVDGDLRSSTGLDAARQTSDAFFVWLSLDPQDFWVNLSPTEPDRIVHHQLGRTDAGRVLLEADLEMKKTVGRLIHPHTALGKRYWNGIQGDCVSSRTWILPGTASVHQDGDKLYILDAPLDVKTETDYLDTSEAAADTPTCPRQDRATEEHNEHLERTLVLPALRKAVNTAPEYAALRRVYLARVAAEWYRRLSLTKRTTYGALMNSGDITDWRLRDNWRPRDTFDAFVTSYTEGEFEVTDRVSDGGSEYVKKYTYGGVDLTGVPVRTVADDAFDADFGTLPQQVDRSLRTPSAKAPGDTVWLGAPTPRQAVTGLRPAEGAASASTWAVRLLPVPLALLALFLWNRRRRLTTRPTSPLRRAATGGSPPGTRPPRR